MRLLFLLLICILLQGFIMDDFETQFHNIVKQAENGIRNGYDPKADTWSPHKSAEGGNDTVAYGHKLLNEEQSGQYVLIGNKKVKFNNLTTDMAHQLYEQDWKKHEAAAKQWLGDGWNNLNRGQQLIATELAFNVKSYKNYDLFKSKVLNNDSSFINEINRTYLDAKTQTRRSLTERTDPIKNWYATYDWNENKSKQRTASISDSALGKILEKFVGRYSIK